MIPRRAAVTLFVVFLCVTIPVQAQFDWVMDFFPEEPQVNPAGPFQFFVEILNDLEQPVDGSFRNFLTVSGGGAVTVTHNHPGVFCFPTGATRTIWDCTCAELSVPPGTRLITTIQGLAPANAAEGAKITATSTFTFTNPSGTYQASRLAQIVVTNEISDPRLLIDLIIDREASRILVETIIKNATEEPTTGDITLVATWSAPAGFVIAPAGWEMTTTASARLIIKDVLAPSSSYQAPSLVFMEARGTYDVRVTATLAGEQPATNRQILHIGRRFLEPLKRKGPIKLRF